MQREGEMGVYHVFPQAGSIVFTHHTRRHVYRHDGGTRSVDVLHDGGIGIVERTLQPRAEKSVDDHVVAAELRRGKFMYDLVQWRTHFSEAVPVCFTVGRKSFLGVEEDTFHPITAFDEHAGYGQGVSAVVPCTGKYHDSLVRIPSLGDFPCDGRGCPFHQVDRGNRFVFDGVAVDLFYFFGWEYLHNNNVFFECG